MNTNRTTDLVGTCPMSFWREWIEEGDAAGEPGTGEEWGWWTKDPMASIIRPGVRLYIVAHGKLRGWAPVVRVVKEGASWVICRRGGAVPCTLPNIITGFRGLRRRWWDRADEVPFPDWRLP